jgi:hypothetical protein
MADSENLNHGIFVPNYGSLAGVILGAGLGTALDFEPNGREYEPRRLGQQYDEPLDIITGLWRGESFGYDGEFYTIEDAILRPSPVQDPRMPILAGGWWPHKKPLQRGARWDGIMPQWPSMLQHFPNVVIDNLDPFYQNLIDEQRSHEEEVREMLEYYHGLDADPGEIMLRVEQPSTPPGFADLCRELGVTWLLSGPVESAATHARRDVRRKKPESYEKRSRYPTFLCVRASNSESDRVSTRTK